MELIRKYIKEYSVVYEKEMTIDSRTEVINAGTCFKVRIFLYNIYGSYLRKKIKIILPEGLAMEEGVSEEMYTSSDGPIYVMLRVLPTCPAGRMNFTCRVLEDKV